MARRSLPVARLTKEDGTVVCERCELAERPLARMRGLLGREHLEPGRGMLIRPSPSVHMFFMRFPIDVVFVDRKLCVVRVVQDLKPWRAASARKASAALELPVGAAAAAALKQGDQLLLQRDPS